MAKLMLVEDDNNLREIYEARLQAEGYDIVTAHDGEEALVVAKAEKPDLVVSDVMMPKISGFEMLDILRNTEGLKEVKVIMLTALGQSDDQQRADRLGADRYLVKSQVTLEDIVKVAHELLGDAETVDETPAADAPAPEPVVTSEPVAVVPAPEPVAVQPAPADDTTTNDVPLGDAINNLVASTPSAALASAPSADDSNTTTSNDPTSGDAVPVAGKKIIEPLPTEQKPDLDTLLALENAREAEAAQAVAAVQPVIGINTDSTPPAPAPTPTFVAPVEDTSDAPQSTAQEEAAVEARIEDFVAGATEVPTAPQAPAPDVAEAPVVEAEVELPTPAFVTPPAPAPEPVVEAPAPLEIPDTQVPAPEPQPAPVVEPVAAPEPAAVPAPMPEPAPEPVAVQPAPIDTTAQVVPVPPLPQPPVAPAPVVEPVAAIPVPTPPPAAPAPEPTIPAPTDSPVAPQETAAPSVPPKPTAPAAATITAVPTPPNPATVDPNSIAL